MSVRQPADARTENMTAEVQQEITDRFSRYCIGLTAVSVDVPGAQPIWTASGTLVSVDGRSGILTARHVLKVLRKYPALCLALRRTPTWIVPIRLDHLMLRSTPLDVPDDSQPDLAFVEIPLTQARDIEIRGEKLFYNLDRRKEEASKWVDLRPGMPCTVSGAPAELIHVEIEDRTIGVYGIHELHAGGRIARVFEENGFDYLDVEISRSESKRELTSFRGVSGGPVWQQLLPDGREISGEYQGIPALIGVALRESDPSKGIITISCHGMKSVYELAHKLPVVV